MVYSLLVDFVRTLMLPFCLSRLSFSCMFFAFSTSLGNTGLTEVEATAATNEWLSLPIFSFITLIRSAERGTIREFVWCCLPQWLLLKSSTTVLCHIFFKSSSHLRSLSVLHLAVWVSAQERETLQNLIPVHFLSDCLLTPLSRCLSLVWSSSRPVPSCRLGSPGSLWGAGRSSAAMCGAFLPTISTSLTWCRRAATWRFEASPVLRMSPGYWPWTPPS